MMNMMMNMLLMVEVIEIEMTKIDVDDGNNNNMDENTWMMLSMAIMISDNRMNYACNN